MADQTEPTVQLWSELDASDFHREVLKAYRQSFTETKDWRVSAREDFDFYAGEEGQWNSDDIALLNEQKRPIVTFNRTAPTIDSVSGAELSNRQEVQYLPRTIDPAPDQVDDAGVAEDFTSAARWVRDECDAEDEESHAFRDCIICGEGWTDTYVNYLDDPDGRIYIERVSPLEVYRDPSASKFNFTDGRWVHRVKMLPKGEVRTKWADAEVTTTSEATEDKPFPLDEEQEQGDSFQRYVNSVPVIETQWWELQYLVRYKDPATQTEMFVTEDEFRQIAKDDPELKGVKQLRRRYFQAFSTEKELLERGPLHPGLGGAEITGFTLQAITGKMNERKRSSFGLMRQMKDPQRWANKWLSQALHIFNAGAKGGLLAERSAFENPQEAELQWADPTAIIYLNEGALSGSGPGTGAKLQERKQLEMPSAIGELMQFAVASIRDATGVNLEFLGLRGKGQAGVVEDSRVRQGMAVLGPFFSNLRRYRKTHGRVLMHFIRTYISDGRMIRITGTNKYMQFKNDRAVATYDLIVDQAPTSPNMKSEVWNGLREILPVMIKQGMPIPPDILDFSPLPNSVIQKIKAFMAQQAQSGQQAAAKAAEREDAEVMKIQTDAIKNVAQADASIMRAETDAKVEQNAAFATLMETLIKATEPPKTGGDE